MASFSFDPRPLTPANAVRGHWLMEALQREGGEPSPEPLAESITADVCIVGGGFAGLWTAIEIKRRAPATDVVVIEAGICGGGASGRNGGFVMTWWPKFATLRKHCGAPAALQLAGRTERAVGDIGKFCEEHGIDAEFRRRGWLWTATNVQQVDAWEATVDAAAVAGAQPFERLSREQVAQRTGSPVHLAGVFEPTVATVQPALLARGLVRAARDLGVRVYERTAMTRLELGDDVRIHTQHNRIVAGTTVLAINAWASRLPQVGRLLVVVSSDVIATEPVPDELESIGWRDGPAISDSRRLVNYYRTSSDGRVVFGKGGGTLAPTGRVGASYLQASPRAGEVTAQFRFVYPMLWEARVDHAWRGPIDYSITGLPFFSRLEGQPNVLIGAGFSGNGVGPAKFAGEVLAEMATEGGDAGLPPILTRPPAGSLPPEPIRYLGGRMVRAAIARKEAREDLGAKPRPMTKLLAGLDPTGFVDRGRQPATPASSQEPAAPRR